MAKYKLKHPVEAVQWWKVGDHAQVYPQGALDSVKCDCGYKVSEHGFLPGYGDICPGMWIVNLAGKTVGFFQSGFKRFFTLDEGEEQEEQIAEEQVRLACDECAEFVGKAVLPSRVNEVIWIRGRCDICKRYAPLCLAAEYGNFEKEEVEVIRLNRAGANNG